MTSRGGRLVARRRWAVIVAVFSLVTVVVAGWDLSAVSAQTSVDGSPMVSAAPEAWPAGDAPGAPAGAVAGTRYHPVSPARIVDTRDGTGGVPKAKVGAGGSISPVVLGVGGVPAADVSAVVVNVTAVGASAQTFVTVWPSGESRPLASNLNVAPGWVIPNLVVAKVGSGGRISLYNNSGTVDLLVDVVGWYGPVGEAAGALHHGLSPARIVDTREGTGGVPVAKVGAGGSITPKVTGVGGVPASGVSAVVLNVTAVGASAQTFVTVWPSGEARPLVSNLNVAPGWVIPNLVVVKVGSGGRVGLFNNSGTVDLLADVVGWFGESGAQQGAAFTGLSPTRIVDTRDGTGGVPKAKVGAGGVITPTVTGVGGVPASGVSAVVLNVTAVGASAQTFVTVWPSGESRPVASNLNVAPGWVIPNLVVAKVGSGGRISLYNNSGTVDLIADVVGWYGPETQWSAARQISYGSVSTNLLDDVSTTDAVGNVHVAWREGSDLLYRRLDAHGNTLVQTVRTGFTPMSSIGYGWRHLSIAVAPDGGVALAWYYPGTNPGIYVARLDSGGRVVTAPVRIRSGSWAYLTTAFDASGAWHLTARESTFPDSSAPSNRVFYGRFTADADGFTPASAWVAVADLVGQGRAISPAMAVQSDGTAHIAWLDNRRFPASGRYDVYYTRIGANGVPSVSAQRMSDVAGGFAYVDDAQNRSLAPAIDVDASGRVTMAWIANTVDVYVATVQAGGAVGMLGTKVDLGAFGALGKGFGIQAHLEADGSTTLVLPVGNDSSSTLVQAVVDATGATKLAAVALPLGSGSWRYPSLTVAGGEQRLVVARNASNTTRLYVVSTAALGDPVDRPDLLVDDAHSTNTSTPSPPREGTTVTMTVQVANAGWVASPATTARFSVGATTLTEVAVPALAVEQTATVTATWTVPVGTSATPAAVTVRVDPAGTVTETTEANNAVDHLVPVRLRPNGAGITAMGWDETADAPHDGNLGVLGFSATLSGTISGGGVFTKTVTAPAAANQAWFGEVPPGTYTLNGSASGYAGPSAVPVTITRDAGDPYVVTVAWGSGGTGSAPQLWFNRWGSITGTVTSGGPLGGVKVTEREQGLTATTAADGSYSLPKLAAGVHHLTFTRDGYGRVQDVPATVAVGATLVVNQGLAPTSVAYVDVTVTNDAGTGLPAATVELVPAGGGAVVASCTTGGEGTCSLQPPGGASYAVRASKPGYVTETGPSFPAVAGRASPQSISLAMDVGTLTAVTTGPRAVLSWVQYDFIPLGGSVWVFWGNYVVDLSATHQNVGGTEHLRSLDIALDGNPFYVELMKNTVSADIGGPYAVQQIPVLTTNTASEATNVRVDAVRVYDRLSGITYYAPPGGPLLYSHTAAADANAQGYALDAGVDWSNVVVTIDVRVGKAVAGTGGAAGWTSSPVLGGWRSDVQRITWVPSENAMTVSALLG